MLLLAALVEVVLPALSAHRLGSQSSKSYQVESPQSLDSATQLPVFHLKLAFDRRGWICGAQGIDLRRD
jgi:hypothetical protein